MALAKYAEDIQEAIYERMAMREFEYSYHFSPTQHRVQQKGGESNNNAVSLKNNEQNGKEELYVG